MKKDKFIESIVIKEIKMKKHNHRQIVLYTTETSTRNKSEPKRNYGLIKQYPSQKLKKLRFYPKIMN